MRGVGKLRGVTIDRLLAERRTGRENVEDWCSRNGVDESAIHRVVQTYGGHPNRLVIALVAFQLGYDARKEQEPRAHAEDLRADGDADRDGVELVVAGGSTGAIVSNARAARDPAAETASPRDSTDASVGSGDER